MAAYEAAEDAAGAARALNGLASVALVQGDTTQAQAWTERALQLRRGLGDRKGAAWLQNTLAGIASARGNFALACEIYADCVDALRLASDEKVLAGVRVNMGAAIVRCRSDEAARFVFEEALEIASRIGDNVGISRAQMHLGSVATARGDFASAERLFGASLATSNLADDDYGGANLLELSGRLRVTQGQLPAAAVVFSAAQRVRSRIAAPLDAALRATQEAEVAALRQAIGDDVAFNAYWLCGSGLTPAQAWAWTGGSAGISARSEGGRGVARSAAARTRSR